MKLLMIIIGVNFDKVRVHVLFIRCIRQIALCRKRVRCVTAVLTFSLCCLFMFLLLCFGNKIHLFVSLYLQITFQVTIHMFASLHLQITFQVTIHLFVSVHLQVTFQVTMYLFVSVHLQITSQVTIHSFVSVYLQITFQVTVYLFVSVHLQITFQVTVYLFVSVHLQITFQVTCPNFLHDIQPGSIRLGLAIRQKETKPTMTSFFLVPTEYILDAVLQLQSSLLMLERLGETKRLR
jgi:hypothetical protein